MFHSYFPLSNVYLKTFLLRDLIISSFFFHCPSFFGGDTSSFCQSLNSFSSHSSFAYCSSFLVMLCFFFFFLCVFLTHTLCVKNIRENTNIYTQSLLLEHFAWINAIFKRVILLGLDWGWVKSQTEMRLWNSCLESFRSRYVICVNKKYHLFCK